MDTTTTSKKGPGRPKGSRTSRFVCSWPVGLTAEMREELEHVLATWDRSIRSRSELLRAYILIGMRAAREQPDLLRRAEGPLHPRSQPAGAPCVAFRRSVEKEEAERTDERPEPDQSVSQIEQDLMDLGVGDPDACNPFDLE